MKLRGNCPAKVDEKGRLKIPAASCAPLSAILRPPEMSAVLRLPKAMLTPFFAVSDTKMWSRMAKNAPLSPQIWEPVEFILKRPIPHYPPLLLPTSYHFSPHP